MSARKLRFTARARADLEDILLYTELHWRPRQVDIYRETILTVLNDLAQFPFIGRKRDEFSAGLLSYPAGEHIVFYRVTDTEVIIRRLVHSRQDLSSMAW
jgi:toxin ParE1/3/4